MSNVDFHKKTQNSAPVTSHTGNGTMFQYSLVIAAVAIFAALTIPFIAHQKGMLQAGYENDIDRVITGSIKKETKRYRIRRSILDAN